MSPTTPTVPLSPLAMTDPIHRELAVTVEAGAPDVLEGIAEIKGVLSFHDDRLSFTYRTRNLLRKVSPRQHLDIPATAVQDVVFRRTLFWTRILVYPRRLDILDEAPGADKDRLVFKVRRADRRQAAAFVTFFRDRLLSVNHAGRESVPFRLRDTDMGMTENRGLLYLDDEFLVFDLQEGIAGLTRQHNQTIKIEPAALVSVRLERGMLNDVLHIRPRKDTLLEALPGEHVLEVQLKISRRHRKAAEWLASGIRLRLQAHHRD